MMYRAMNIIMSSKALFTLQRCAMLPIHSISSALNYTLHSYSEDTLFSVLDNLDEPGRWILLITSSPIYLDPVSPLSP